jgi:hypothetical protein
MLRVRTDHELFVLCSAVDGGRRAAGTPTLVVKLPHR